MGRRILILINARSPFFDYWRKFPDWDQLDLEPVFASIHRSDNQTDITLISITDGNPIMRYIKLWRKLPEIIEQEKIDLIHAQYLSHHGLIAASRSKKPVLLTLYGSDVFHKPPLYFRFLRRYLKRITLIHAQSKYTLQQIAHVVPEDRLYLQHWGISPKYFDNQYDQLRSEPVIFSPRNFVKLYNIEKVVRVMALVVPQVEDCRLIMLRGYTDPADTYVKHIYQLISELGLQDHITIIDRILNAEEMRQFYRQATINLNIPTKDQLALSILEGMSQGSIPIIAELETYREHLVEDENAIYWDGEHISDLAEKIITLLRNKDKQQQMIENNIALVNEIGSFPRNMTKIYQEFLERVDT